MAGARGQRERPVARRVQTPSGSWTYAELHAAARAGRGRAGRARRRPRRPRRDRAAAGTRLRPGAARVPAAGRRRRARRPASRAPPSGRRIADGAAVLRRRAAAGAGRRRPRRRAASAVPARHDLDATARGRPHLRHDRRAATGELTYGNLLWSALGSAVALASTREERWLCTLPLSHVGGLVDPAALGDLRDDRGRARALRDRPRAARADARGGRRSSASSRRRSRGCSTRACARRRRCAARSPAAARCPAALRRARARRPGVPVSLTYGLTETCSQVDHDARSRRSSDARRHAPGRRCSARGCGSPQDGEILVAGPTVAARRVAAGRLAAHGRPRRARRARAPARHRPQGRHDRQRRRERRAGRGRGGARGASRRCSRPRCSAARTREWGEAVTAIVVVRAGRGARRGRSCARTAPARSPPYKVPKELRARRPSRCRARASGKLLRRELAMSFDADAHRRGAACEGWEEAAPGWVRRQELMRELRGAGLAVDDRRDRPAAGRARARAGRRARRDGRCSPPSWSRRRAA